MSTPHPLLGVTLAALQPLPWQEEVVEEEEACTKHAQTINYASKDKPSHRQEWLKP
jgi:hypothetical protein